jgi:hypothetical protein
MKCRICECESNRGSVTPLGLCCENCLDEDRREWKEILDRERAADIFDGPEEFGLADFERFALRLAVKALDSDGEAIRKANPWLAAPSELSMLVKERLIEAMPERFSTIQARGHERLFRGGAYRIIGKIPKDELMAGCVKAGLLHQGEPK